MRISSNDHIIIAFVLDHHKNRRMNQNRGRGSLKIWPQEGRVHMARVGPDVKENRPYGERTVVKINH
jgi:hypothetical protein